MNNQKESGKTWKVIDLINTSTEYFSNRGIENPRLNAELLLASILNWNRVDLYVNYDQPVKPDEIAAYKALIKRRSQNEPLQYILGHTEFMGFVFEVNPAVLIPRPETELLVEHIVKSAAELCYTSPSIIDIGTGSGCIAVSLARLIPRSAVYAVDVSLDALKIAQENAVTNQDLENTPLPIQFFPYDVFSDWPENLPKKFDILVSNPPYIAQSEMPALPEEVLHHEPEIALCDGADGLKFYQRIFELSKNKIRVSWLYLEMSGSQPEKIIKTAEQYGFQNIQVKKDLNGIDRILSIRV
ncbi:MAG: peptide chain release factor N(5)-glutamine methyltransferase [Calditrichaceae bacterium]|nr:peptide chain release factor N(5)-glutamine methyltransferase [Calditrichaceae bacterium]MBN2707692.1 peptide chain release factor N(5)-glutamine methyltransferase [Calditrichaceae bacterium]RQV96494.1 MAG: peptide chain release factor N(5)-glutamine methyltransferase [Calditrichota bacterium]